MLLNAHAGAKYGIPFPVLARASFGVLGANVPAVLRALVACGWFGINTWIGARPLTPWLWFCFPRGAIMPREFGFALRVLALACDRHRAGYSDHQISSGRHRAVSLAIGIALLAWP